MASLSWSRSSETLVPAQSTYRILCCTISTRFSKSAKWRQWSDFWLRVLLFISIKTSCFTNLETLITLYISFFSVDWCCKFLAVEKLYLMLIHDRVNWTTPMPYRSKPVSIWEWSTSAGLWAKKFSSIGVYKYARKPATLNLKHASSASTRTSWQWCKSSFSKKATQKTTQ